MDDVAVDMEALFPQLNHPTRQVLVFDRFPISTVGLSCLELGGKESSGDENRNSYASVEAASGHQVAADDDAGNNVSESERFHRYRL
jgi:hypothetical protein